MSQTPGNIRMRCYTLYHINRVRVTTRALNYRIEEYQSVQVISNRSNTLTGSLSHPTRKNNGLGLFSESPSISACSKSRNTGIAEHRNTGTPEDRNIGTSEHRNIGTSEHRNTGTPEHRNTGTPNTPENWNSRKIPEPAPNMTVLFCFRSHYRPCKK